MPGYIIFSGLVLLLFTSVVQAAVLVAVDDSMGVPLGQPLQVEAFGVLENDTLDGNSAGETGATAKLVSDVSYGTLSCPTDLNLALCPDGSFDYLPDPGLGFTGTDSFTYQAVFGADVSEPATVTLTACTGGPEVLSCWQEAPYLAKLTELGYMAFREGFEGAAWDGVRSIAGSTVSAPSITNKGITWTSNHSGTNDITTSAGAARTGLWGAYDPDHGYATGSGAECDIDNPPNHCLYHDGLSGKATSGNALLAVGGYITGTYGSNIAIFLDSNSTPYNAGRLPDTGHHFFGVIDVTGGGFSSFEFHELDGKIGQQNLIWADDFIIATSDTVPVNNPPVLDPIGDRAVNENELLSILLSASDPDGDGLSFSKSVEPATAILEDNFDGTATFSWRPDFDQAGDHPVSFTVTDNGFPAASDSEDIIITVVDVNRPPALSPIGNRTVNENELLIIPLAASDPDGDNLSFSMLGAPTGASLIDNVDGTADFNWTPGTGQSGIYAVNFMVTDSGLPAASDSEEIAITVGTGDCTDVNSVISIDTTCAGSFPITVHPGVIVKAPANLIISGPGVYFVDSVSVELRAALRVIITP